VRGSQILDCLKIGAYGHIEKLLKFKDRAFAANFFEIINEALGKE
jgi:hypothetical protein